MKQSFVFLADGFEEIEALTVVDVLRRAGMNVKTVSITSSLKVTGAHGVNVGADVLFDSARFKDADWLIFPGGMPGASNLYEFAPLQGLIKKHAKEGGNLAAICAAPAVVFGQLGLLDGKSATCYPGFESLCQGAKMQDSPVVIEANMVLGSGPANALPWSLAIVRQALGHVPADKIACDMLLYSPTSTNDYNFG